MPSRPPDICPIARPGLHRYRGLRRGLTLVELMITLSVLVIVLAVALPSMAEFNANNQVVATKSGFAGAVALARTEAAKRGRVVVLQALGSGAVGNEFANGWEIVVDDDGSGGVDANETRVRRHALALQHITLGGTASLAFRASGALVGTAAEVYTICRTGGTKGFTVTVTPSGSTDVATINTCT
jgi:type IV fimbrial biogenesis protein FimT